MADKEQRLARLEEGLYFQEKKLDDLDAALLAQQGQIDMLENKLAVAEEKLSLLLASSQTDQSGQTGDGPEQNLPPHFMPERY